MTDPFAYLIAPVEHHFLRAVNTGLYFIDPVDNDRRQTIEELTPPPLLHTYRKFGGGWAPCFLCATSDEWPEPHIRATYNEEIAAFMKAKGVAIFSDDFDDLFSEHFDTEAEDEEVEAFVDHIDRWVHAVHGVAPLSIFFCQEQIERAPYPDWERRSFARFEEIVLPALVRAWENPGSGSKVCSSNVTFAICGRYLAEGDPSSAARQTIDDLGRTVLANGGIWNPDLWG
jgi:hypothetical protein